MVGERQWRNPCFNIIIIIYNIITVAASTCKWFRAEDARNRLGKGRQNKKQAATRIIQDTFLPTGKKK